MLRRLKEEVMSQLPPKRRQVIRLPHPRPEDWPKQAGESDCTIMGLQQKTLTNVIPKLIVSENACFLSCCQPYVSLQASQ